MLILVMLKMDGIINKKGCIEQGLAASLVGHCMLKVFHCHNAVTATWHVMVFLTVCLRCAAFCMPAVLRFEMAPARAPAASRNNTAAGDLDGLVNGMQHMQLTCPLD